jgi:hypothetical protein
LVKVKSWIQRQNPKITYEKDDELKDEDANEQQKDDKEDGPVSNPRVEHDLVEVLLVPKDRVGHCC